MGTKLAPVTCKPERTVTTGYAILSLSHLQQCQSRKFSSSWLVMNQTLLAAAHCAWECICTLDILHMFCQMFE